MMTTKLVMKLQKFEKIKPILEVRNLMVRLGGQVILEDIRLDLIPGTIHALLGPNGAGKTTLIRSLVGSLPHKGEITFRFQGNSRRIGYVPQLLEFDHSLPYMVGDFLAIMLRKKPVFLKPRKSLRREILACLKVTGCDHLIDRLIGSLSGGELRRVLLAQALTPVPEVLLLDEPASNIDEHGARAFEETLVKLKDEMGIAIMVVGHDLATILRMADFVTGINKKVTYTGPVDNLSDPNLLDLIYGAQAFEMKAGCEVIC